MKVGRTCTEENQTVATKAGALHPETVGKIETKPPGSDLVLTAGLLPWLTEAVGTTHRALPREHAAHLPPSSPPPERAPAKRQSGEDRA